MPSKRQAFESVLIAVGVIVVGVIVFLCSPHPARVVPVAVVEKTSVPVRLIIPSIKVDAAIEQVGLASDGVLGVPKDPDNVGWFTSGPRPGEVGNAIIDGHYGWTGGRAVVFDDLSQLAASDKVYVQNGEGSLTTFVVTKIESYDPNADATAVFTSTDGKSHLNLITCEGTWNAGQQSYSKRLIVFADKE